ncbi:MAG: hypothetical protein NTY11_01730 [Candidatus Parcubacteria bacterium]|nr:hypothetical protein [Candidatus Parcubacteria bacterium]
MLPKGSIAKLYEYYFTAPQFADEVIFALQGFFNRSGLDRGSSLNLGSEKSKGLFNEWFLYDFIMADGYTPLEHFVNTNPFNLEEAELKLYRDLLDNRFGIFEALEIELGHSLTIKDLQTGEEWFVLENKGTYDLEKNRLFFGRVGKVDDHYELVGADSFSIEDVDGVIKKSFRNTKFKITPKEVNDILNTR